MLRPGEYFEQRYQIISQIGQGGCGIVFKAQDVQLSRLVAIKFLTPAVATNPRGRDRFLREAKSLCSLVHPNILRFLAYGYSDERQCSYFVTEYCPGKSLSELIKEQQRLPVHTVQNIGLQLCSALQAAHTAGFIHRDVKCTNVMIDSNGLVKLLDFGLVKLLDKTNALQLTQAGSVVGSVHYMSPEVCVGRAATAESDVYSLACVLYEGLSGQPPFDFPNAAGIQHMHVYAAPKMISGPLAGPIMKALNKDPNERYSSAQEFAAALSECPTETTPLAEPFKDTSTPNHCRFNIGPRTWMVVGLAATCSMLVIGGFSFLQERSRQELVQEQRMQAGRQYLQRVDSTCSDERETFTGLRLQCPYDLYPDSIRKYVLQARDFRSSNYPEVEKLYKLAAVELQKKEPRAPSMLLLEIERANNLSEHEVPNLAIEEWSKAGSIASDLQFKGIAHHAYIAAGLAATSLHQWPAAATLYLEAAQYVPASAPLAAHATLQLALFSTKQSAEQLRILDKMLTLDPKDSRLYVMDSLRKAMFSTNEDEVLRLYLSAIKANSSLGKGEPDLPQGEMKEYTRLLGTAFDQVAVFSAQRPVATLLAISETGEIPKDIAAELEKLPKLLDAQDYSQAENLLKTSVNSQRLQSNKYKALLHTCLADIYSRDSKLSLASNEYAGAANIYKGQQLWFDAAACFHRMISSEPRQSRNRLLAAKQSLECARRTGNETCLKRALLIAYGVSSCFHEKYAANSFAAELKALGSSPAQMIQDYKESEKTSANKVQRS